MESVIERIEDLSLHIPDVQETETLILDSVILATGASLSCTSNNDSCQVLSPLDEELFSKVPIIYARGTVVLKTTEETVSLNYVEIDYDERIELVSDATDNLERSPNSNNNRGLIIGLSVVVAGALIFLTIAAANKLLAMKRRSEKQQNADNIDDDSPSSSPSSDIDHNNVSEGVGHTEP